jgi:quercetin dioxygenase-like cupin family protein
MLLASRSLAPACLIAGLALGLGLAAEAAQPVKPAQHFSFPGKRPTFKEQYVKPEIVVSSVDSEGDFSLIDEVWGPEFKVPAHYHKTHAETFYVISGEVEWTVGGETHVMKAGDLVHIPAYTVHSTRVVGGKDMHTLMISQPGGFEEVQWFQEKLTPEQQKDPKIRKIINLLGDFYMPDANTRLATQPIGHFNLAGKDRLSYPDDGTSDVALSSKDSGGRLNIQDEIWNPDFVVGSHFHKRHSETFYVLDGRVEWTVGGETHVMSHGDAVHIPPNTIHSVKTLDNKPAHMLMLYHASGYDTHLEEQSLFSEEDLKNPATRELLREISDFNPVEN